MKSYSEKKHNLQSNISPAKSILNQINDTFGKSHHFLILPIDDFENDHLASKSAQKPSTAYFAKNEGLSNMTTDLRGGNTNQEQN